MPILDDLRLAFRTLRTRPGFLTVALATLGIAIGANVAVFTLVNAVMLRPLPFGDRSERIVSVHAVYGSGTDDWEDARLSYADLQDLRRAGVLEEAAGYVSRNFTLEDGAAERVRGGSVTPELFPLLGIEPALGRPFTMDDAAEPGFESAVIVTHGLWQRRMGGRPDVIGSPLRMNGRVLTVVGVMPAGFAFPERDELYVPLRWESAPRTQRTVSTFALLAPDQSIADAGHRVAAFAGTLSRTHPSSHDGWSMRVLPFRDLMVSAGDRRSTTTLLAAVAFVLLIGCANLAGLLLARGEARRREYAVRAALGASRWQLIRGSLLESAAIAACGTASGVLVAAWTLDLMPLAFADGLPYWVNLRPDVRVVLFTTGLMAVTAVMLGIAPGLRFSRPDANDTLKTSPAGSTATRSVQRLRALLVVGQVALSVALLTAAILMVRSFLALQEADAGFDESRILSFRTYVAGDRYDALPARAAALSAVIDELQSRPGLARAALTSSIPTDDGGPAIRLVPGAEWRRGEERAAQQVAISDGFFETLGIDLDGRAFTPSETVNPDADVVIVGRRLAARLWPGEAPLDRRLGVVTRDGVEWRRVVGVAADVVYEEFGEETEQSRLVVYVPFARTAPRTAAVMVRSSGAPEGALAIVRDAMRAEFPGFPAYDLRTMRELREYTTWEQRVFGQVMAVFAAIAVLLAWIGVYGLVAYTVARRTREIGVRMALGAQRWSVLRMVASDVFGLAVAGLALGVLLGRALTTLLAGAAYGVDAGDPALVAAAAAAMALAMAAAAWWPARRATRLEPMAALRCE
jgi:predicted permease